MTDPDAHLRKLRSLVARANAAGWGGDALLLDELAVGIRDLDRSLSSGGPLPSEWANPIMIVEKA